MTAPLFSVILPVYNRAHGVTAALDSALTQTVTDLEVVLVDDGSTDDLHAVLEGYKSDPRLRVLTHPERRGAAAARNTAIAAARGTWLAFLDSDDEWLPNKLEIQLASLQRADSSVRMSLAASLLDRGAAGRQVRVPETRPSCRDVILRGCTLCPGSAAVVERAAFLECGPFDEKLDRLEDWDWLLRFTRRWTYVVTPEPLAVIRVRDYRNYQVVDRMTGFLWQRYRAEIRQEGLRAWRRFAGAILVERACARLVLHRYIAGGALLAVALMLDPRWGEFYGRLSRRIFGTQEPRQPMLGLRALRADRGG